jgi:hypothetical protein
MPTRGLGPAVKATTVREEFLSLCVLLADENHTAVWTENVISAVQLPIDGTAGSLGISMSTSGWLRCWIHGRSRLIWLPHDRRGQVFTSIRDRVAVIADNGTPTVLTFSVG